MTAGLSAPVSAPAPVVAPARVRRVRLETLSLLVPILVAALLSVFHVRAYTTISLFDEQAHFGYVVDLRQGHLPHRGDTIPQQAVDEVACRYWDVGFSLPCAKEGGRPQPGSVHASDLPANGLIYTVNHPPLYYAASAALGSALDLLPGVDSYLVAVRLSGIAWTAASLVFLWLILRRLRIGSLPRFGALLIVASLPAAIYTGSIVNPDVTALPCMLAMVWALVRWERGRRQPWLLALLGAVVIGCKITNAIIPLGAVVFLLIRSLQTGSWRDADRRLRAPSRLRAVLALGAGSLAVYSTWTAYLHLTDTSVGRLGPLDRTIGSLPWNRVLRFDSAFLLQPPVGNLPLPIIPEIRFALFPLIVSVIALLPIAGCIVVLGCRSSGPMGRALAMTGLAMSVVGPAAFVVFNYVSDHSWLPSAVRYFYATLAFQFVAMALAIASCRLGRLALGVGAAASLLYGGLLVVAG